MLINGSVVLSDVHAIDLFLDSSIIILIIITIIIIITLLSKSCDKTV